MGPHILITGAVGVGKSTLIRRLLGACTLSVRGFRTWPSQRDEEGRCSFFISPAWETEPVGTEDNRIGRVGGSEREAFPAVFDRLGPPLLAAKAGDVIVMDELGWMEEDAEAFKNAVFACLDGEIPVLGVVKRRPGQPFLDAVRRHPRVLIVEIDEDSRDGAFERLLPQILRWNRSSAGTSNSRQGPDPV